MRDSTRIILALCFLGLLSLTDAKGGVETDHAASAQTQDRLVAPTAIASSTRTANCRKARANLLTVGYINLQLVACEDKVLRVHATRLASRFQVTINVKSFVLKSRRMR